MLGDGPPRRADRRRRAGAALPRRSSRSSRGAAPGRGRHPRRGVRAGARPRPGGDLGRRRRPARRAARAVPPHPRGAAACAPSERARRRCVGGFARSVEARVPAPHRLGARAGRRPATPLRDRGHRVASPAPPTASSSATRWPAAPGCRSRCTTRSAAGLEPGPVLRADPAARATPPRWPATRCRTPARCTVCTGPAAACPAAHRAAGLPLVRHRRDPAWACPECGRRGLRAPVLGDAADRRGARPGLPAARRCARSAGDRVLADGRRRAGDRGGHAGRRAGRRGRLRRRGAARHLAAAGPPRPAHRRGGAAPLGQRGRRWSRPGGRARGRGRRPGRTRRCRRWSGGTRPASPRARSAERAVGAPAAGLPAGDHHRRARGRRRRARPLLGLPAGAEVLGPVPAHGRDRADDGQSRLVVRVPRAQGPALSRALGELQRRALGPQARRRSGSRSTRSGSAERRPRLGGSHPSDDKVPAWPSSPSACSATRCCAQRAARGRRLRQGAAHAGRGPHRHHARRPRRRPRRPADRRRAAGVHLERRRRGRPPGQPGARPVRGDPGRPRGLPVDPRPDASTAGGRCRVVAHGLRHARRAGHDRGLRAAGPGDPARDRPPRRRALPRPARPARPASGDEGDPRVRVVRPASRRRSRCRPHPTGGLGL